VTLALEGSYQLIYVDSLTVTGGYAMME